MRNGKIQVLGVWLGNSDLASQVLRREGRTLGGSGSGPLARIAVFLPHKLVHAALLAQGGYSREARDRARVLGVLPRRAASPASGQGWCWAWLCMDPPSFPDVSMGGPWEVGWGLPFRSLGFSIVSWKLPPPPCATGVTNCYLIIWIIAGIMVAAIPASPRVLRETACSASAQCLVLNTDIGWVDGQMDEWMDR